MQRYEEQYQLLCMLSSILLQEHPIPFSNKMLSLALFVLECHTQLTSQV